jgi:HEAT repeat protein
MLWWTLRDLKAEDWRKRQGAARKLGELEEPRAIELLVATLKDKNAQVRHAAGEALIRIGNPAINALMAALKNKNAEVRLAAEEALVNIGGPAVISLGLALYDKDLGVREAAATALGRIGDDQAMEQLLAGLKYGDFGAKEAAAAGLVCLGRKAVKPLVASLKDNKVRVREIAAAALTRIGPAAIEPLVMALKDSDVREAATEALWKIDPGWTKSDAAKAAVPVFLTTLREGDERTRKAAATVLGAIGDAVVFEALAAALMDGHESVQEAAATALGEMGDPRGLVPLVAVLQKGGTKVRHAAAAALVRLGKALVEPLVEALKAPEGAVREVAAAVMVRIGHSAVEPLVEALWQIDPEWAKAEESKAALPRFVAALKDGGSNLLRESGETLKRMNDERMKKSHTPVVKDKAAGVRKSFSPLAASGEAQDVKALAESLNNPDPELRASALHGLLQIGNTAEEPLTAALKNKNPTVRRAAAHALAARGDARGRDILRADLKHGSELVLLDAADSLARIGDISSVKPLVKMLNGYYEAPAEDHSAQSYKAKRVFRLLQVLLETYAEDLLVEDLHALVQFSTKGKPGFVASSDSKTKFGVMADPAAAEQNLLPGSNGEVDGSKLRDLARRELNRRIQKA